MLESGKYYELINEKIATLKIELGQCGPSGLTNLHKHCENFVMRLLNIVYDYDLENLNKKVSTFPGLDLGSVTKGIGYQVTSEKTSPKVDDTIDKVTRYGHYHTFSDIRIFMMLGKQSSYSIQVPTLFAFDWKKNLWDFDDVLRDIQHLPVNKLKEVFEFMESELPGHIDVLRGKQPAIGDASASIINMERSLQESGTKYFEHFSFRITLRGKTLSVPVLFEKINEYYSRNQNRVHFLPLLNPAFLSTRTAQLMQYREKLSTRGAGNVYYESVLQFTQNTIQFETTKYQNDITILDNLNAGLFPLLTLLLFFKTLYGTETCSLELDVDLSTNGELSFYNMSSICSINHTMQSHYLNPRKLSFSKVLQAVSNVELTDTIERCLHGFVSAANDHFNSSPFLSLHLTEQQIVLDNIRSRFNPPLSEL